MTESWFIMMPEIKTREQDVGAETRITIKISSLVNVCHRATNSQVSVCFLPQASSRHGHANVAEAMNLIIVWQHT
jgi:hypothetical protein